MCLIHNKKTKKAYLLLKDQTKLNVSAERAWPGVSGSHRTVAAEEKQNAQWKEWTAGGASRAHTGGGTLFLYQVVIKCDSVFLKDPAVCWASLGVFERAKIIVICHLIAFVST